MPPRAFNRAERPSYRRIPTGADAGHSAAPAGQMIVSSQPARPKTATRPGPSVQVAPDRKEACQRHPGATKTRGWPEARIGGGVYRANCVSGGFHQ